MHKFNYISESFNDNVHYIDMFQQGLEIDEIRLSAISILDKYFDNKTVLEKHIMNSLMPEVVNCVRLKEDTALFNTFEEVIDIFKKAKIVDSLRCFNAFAFWETFNNESIYKFWNIHNTQIDKSDLEIEEFAYECFREIGALIEGCIKNYLKIILHSLYIINNNQKDENHINNLDLGKLINEINQINGTNNLCSITKPYSWNIPLSQWRNIAYHHSYINEQEIIKCTYGKSPNLKQINLSRIELINLEHVVFEIFRAVKLAYTLFFVDNVDEIIKYPIKHIKRKEAKTINFMSELSFQGFNVIESIINDDLAKIIIVDMIDPGKNRRPFRYIKLLVDLWEISNSKNIEIEYKTIKKETRFVFKADSSLISKIANNQGKIDDLIKNIEVIRMF